MKNFRTELHLNSPPLRFGLSDPIFTIGSCFADHIGAKMEQNKFQTSVNTLGISYNPLSIHRALLYALKTSPVTEETYVQQGQLWSNYEFHSLFSAPAKEEVTSKIKQSIDLAHDFLRKTKVLIITYGSAWAYQRTDTGALVANCHKVDAKKFNKILQTSTQIEESFHLLYQTLKSFNESLTILLTVSPVRHIKDSLELNQVSKSILRVACHHIQNTHSAVDYFPAYEIMMDDLRDYRFYESDMIHPSADAIDYIWDKFHNHYFDDPTKDFIHQWKSISADLRHRPFHPQTEAHQKFLKETLKKLEILKTQVNVDNELSFVVSCLTKS